jgi:ornithine cyclodeaminase
MDWRRAIDAIRAGHAGARPVLQDLLLQQGCFTLFGRGVILPGLGAGMKVASLFPPNAEAREPSPVEHAVFLVIEDKAKRIVAILDGPEITRWKTAADSALGSEILSPVDSATLLVLGAGPIATALAEAHLSVRPLIGRVLLWNRNSAKLHPLAETLRRRGLQVEVVSDLTRALPEADVITSATSSEAPLVSGELLRERCHVDLVGSYRRDMRESDDALMKRADIYVNNRATGIQHTGDLWQAIENGAITAGDVKGDLFDIVSGAAPPRKRGISVYKNAGGAHIDLLVSLAALKTLDEER